MEIEELMNEWKSFNLMDGEKDPLITLDKEDERNINGHFDYCLVSKLRTYRIIS